MLGSAKTGHHACLHELPLLLLLASSFMLTTMTVCTFRDKVSCFSFISLLVLFRLLASAFFWFLLLCLCAERGSPHWGMPFLTSHTSSQGGLLEEGFVLNPLFIFSTWPPKPAHCRCSVKISWMRVFLAPEHSPRCPVTHSGTCSFIGRITFSPGGPQTGCHSYDIISASWLVNK